DAAAGGETAGHFNFVANAADGFGVAHDEESADGSIFFLHKIQRDLDVAAGGGDELALLQRTFALEGIEDQNSQGESRKKISCAVLPRSSARGRPRKRSTG